MRALSTGMAGPFDAALLYLRRFGQFRSSATECEKTQGAPSTWTLLAATVLVASCLHCLTLRAGHGWGDDFALYIRHAQNLTEGRPYADTGYIYHPQLPSLSPHTYPPGFPVLLVPLYALFGLNLTAMKLLLTGCFLALAAVCCWGFRTTLSGWYLGAAVAALAWHPYFAAFKENVLSDLPFTLFVYLTLFTFERVQVRSHGSAIRWSDAVLLGVLLYVVGAFRTVGLVLIPCVLAADLARCRRITRTTLAAAALALLLAVGQARLVPGGDGYLDQINLNLVQVVRANAALYAEAFFDLWSNGFSKPLQYLLAAVLSLLALSGFLRQARTRISVLHLFVAAYTGVVLLWPAYQAGRFLLPLLPAYFFYAVLGFRQLTAPAGRAGRCAAAGGLCAALFLTYLGGYRSLEAGPISPGVQGASVDQCFEYVRTQTRKDDVFVFSKPRALALFTARAASAYHAPTDDRDQWDYLQRIGAGYVIVGDGPAAGFAKDRAYLTPFIQRHRDRFELSFANEDFKVYRIRERPPGLPETRLDHLAALSR